MTPHKIKALLVENEIPQTKIAKDLHVTNATVSIVIAQHRRSYRVEKYIADLLGMTYEDIWGAEPRRKAA